MVSHFDENTVNVLKVFLYADPVKTQIIVFHIILTCASPLPTCGV